MENMLRNNRSTNGSINRFSVKKWLTALLLVFFVLISFFSISSLVQDTSSEYRSSQLRKVTVKDGNKERTDFVDSSGKIAIAADQGYATMIVTKNENGKIEQYYNEYGEPITRVNGYQAVFREYDKLGYNIRNTYLDAEGNPILTANGYAEEEREYNEKKQLIAIKYYDTEGSPVASPYFGYGTINEYDDNGKNIKTTYINANGNPMVTKYGYASVVRVFYETEGPENGKIKYEFYYNEYGEPTALSLGQYGVHKEYDENCLESFLTYLDAGGNPTATNKGYTSVIRTYHANNSMATERYYDQEGNPYSLPEGQYGTKKKNGQTIYLDQNEREIFNFRTILYNHTWLVIPFSVFFIIFSSLLSRKWNILMLLLYLFVIVYLTLMYRDSNSKTKIGFLWYYSRILTSSEARSDILKNIWLFIPLGAILYQLYPKKQVLLVPIVLSIVIEVIQYIYRIGFCEFDDVISNGLGGWIGFIACKQTIVIKLHIGSWAHKMI